MANTKDQSTFSKRFIVAAIGTALMIALGAAAISSDGAGAVEGIHLDDGKHLLSDAKISPQEAIDIALDEANGKVDDVDLEREGAELIYEIEIDDTDVYVHAIDGTVLHLEYDNDDDIVSRPKVAGDGRQGDSGSTSGTDSTAQPAIPPTEAVEIAQEEVSGTVEDVDLERKSGQWVYEVEIDDTDVYIDAQDGSVLYIDYDDDDDWESAVDAGTRTDGPQFSDEEAVTIAQGEVDGQVDDVELERKGGQLVYEIEVGNYEVYVDAVDGSVLKVEWDD